MDRSLWVIPGLLLVLLALQYRLWIGDGSLAEVRDLQAQVLDQQAELARLEARNRRLEAEVSDLRSGLEAIEARARGELGMIKTGEVFYQIVEETGP